MKLENQVLSINQVQELIELGFDVEKYASMKYIDGMLLPNESKIKVIGEPFGGCNYPTLTIGDIMEILPALIRWDFGLRIEKFTNDNINDYQITYKENLRDETLYFTSEANLIDALLETLKWCIKEKHLAL